MDWKWNDKQVETRRGWKSCTKFSHLFQFSFSVHPPTLFGFETPISSLLSTCTCCLRWLQFAHHQSISPWQQQHRQTSGGALEIVGEEYSADSRIENSKISNFSLWSPLNFTLRTWKTLHSRKSLIIYFERIKNSTKQLSCAAFFQIKFVLCIYFLQPTGPESIYDELNAFLGLSSFMYEELCKRLLLRIITISVNIIASQWTTTATTVQQYEPKQSNVVD